MLLAWKNRIDSFVSNPALFCAFGFFVIMSSCQNEDGALAIDQSNLHIRTTEPLSPDNEQAMLRVPPGFVVELFAAEPDIAKPLNMAFDERGRMWVTHSYEYPFADTTGAGRDRISILEDTDRDGRADVITVFADSLNIPIGLTPVPDGAIAYSIPGIYRFYDYDGDDRADEKKLLYGGFRYKDTHGMVNNFERSWDGWIHANHGFANTSRVSGSDGDTIVMASGNTFRFRMDGSRLEFTTTGRVNPYGYAYDELGYTYSTDCHTSPLYQLVRGADYPHFAKKPTGIGFGPAMMEHDYGATALAGLELYLGDSYPESYQNSFYIGDVVKNRVYRTKVDMIGTTPINKWQEDFVVSEDPWFRPVDVVLGPDGALYIADFYNRIIGHYEVDLEHPGRDRHRGRIWRVSYKGDENLKAQEPKDLAKMKLKELIDNLDHPNLPFRMSIADQITDRERSKAIEPLLKLVLDEQSNPKKVVQGLWILFRLSALSEAILLEAIASDHELLRTQALRVLFELDKLSENTVDATRSILVSDESPHVKRQALMVLGKNVSLDNLDVILNAYSQYAESDDTHMFYVVRQVLRDHMRSKDIVSSIKHNEWSVRDQLALADVMVGVNLPEAAIYLSEHIDSSDIDPSDLIGMVAHVVKFLPKSSLDGFVQRLQDLSQDDLVLGMGLYQEMEKGYFQRGQRPDEIARLWGEQLSFALLNAEKFENTDKSNSYSYGALLAGKYNVESTLPLLNTIIDSRVEVDEVRFNGFQALHTLNPDQAKSQFSILVQNKNESQDLKEDIGLFYTRLQPEGYQEMTEMALPFMSYTSLLEMALQESDNPSGMDWILDLVEAQHVSAQVLLEQKFENANAHRMSESQREKYDRLTKDVRRPDVELSDLIRQRSRAMVDARPSLVEGKSLFTMHCATCHQIAGEGSLIGPQLDGIGTWGRLALTEKIYAPNRNISKAFVNYDIDLKDGQSTQGLLLRDEDENMVFANIAGQEFSLLKDDIVERSESPYTLMPDNFKEIFTEEEYEDLIAFLLEQKGEL